MDIEYGTDEYYDIHPDHSHKGAENTAGPKRKRVTNDRKSRGKRQKLGEINHGVGFDEPEDTVSISRVLWIPATEVFVLQDSWQRFRGTKPYALLPDWKEQFKNEPGFETVSALDSLSDAVVMEGITADVATECSADRSYDEHEEDIDDEDDANKDDDDFQSDNANGGLDIDPEILMSALSTKISSMGLGEAQQGAFVQSMMQMLSEGKGANLEDILGELTTELLNQASEGGEDSGLTNWLSQQGVSLELDEDDAQSGDGGVQLTTSDGQRSRSSPRDSAVSEQGPRPARNRISTNAGPLLGASTLGRGKTSAIFDGTSVDKDEKNESRTAESDSKNRTSASGSGAPSVRSVQVRKRKASVGETETTAEAPKRRLRSFAAPTASSQSKAAEPAKKDTRFSRQKK